MRAINGLRGVLGESAGERGVVLVTALLVMLVLLPLGAAFLAVSLTETTIASNEVSAAQGFGIAEAGLEHARRELVDAGKINSVLATCTGGPCTAPINFTNGGQNVSFAGGTYSVAVRDDPDDPNPSVDSNYTVIVTSTGTVQNTTQMIEATIGREKFIEGALITGGDLDITGDLTVSGPYGTIHANGGLMVSGNPTISEDLTASGTYSGSGSPTVGGTLGGGMPTVEIPLIDPADYRPLADYVLKADQKVYQSDGVTVVFDTSGGDAWPSNNGGWKHDGAKWVWGGDVVQAVAESVFYIEGSAEVTSSPGTPGNPWDATVIAEGYIKIAGNPNMQAKAENLLLIAGTDVDISGDLTAGGIIAAHEQVGLSGNPTFTLYGYVLAEDAATNDNTVLFSYVSGNPSFAYDGTLPSQGSSSLDVLTWRQLF